MTLIIGLTGQRGVGKSEVTRILVDRGFRRAHAFEGGKTASKAYFMHLGADEVIAESMINGVLKDKPSPFLPNRESPRYFMEHFGKWMGTHPSMGPTWTLGAELDRLLMMGDAPIVAESVVYEGACCREKGGVLVRVARPDHIGPIGLETDRVEREIAVRYTIMNDGSLEDLETKVTLMLLEVAK